MTIIHPQQASRQQTNVSMASPEINYFTSSPLSDHPPPIDQPSPTNYFTSSPLSDHPSPRGQPSPSTMPPASGRSPPSTTMPPFSQRKVQAARDHLMLQMNDTELDELAASLQNRQRRNRATGTSNQSCGLLKLPPEILNMIYEEVAADAHTRVATPYVKDTEGKKVRPGLLGTCHQVYTEFFGVFWSSKYIRCGMFGNQGQEIIVGEPKLLYAIANNLLGCLMFTTRRTTNPIEHCREQVRRGNTVDEDLNAWVGFMASQCSGPAAFGTWSEFMMLVWNPKSDSVVRSMKMRSDDFVVTQGLVFSLRDKDKLRVI